VNAAFHYFLQGFDKDKAKVRILKLFPFWDEDGLLAAFVLNKTDWRIFLRFLQKN
jgi:hypothetical protein